MVLGIDLGTTYSVAAYLDESGTPCAVCNAEGDTTTPSVVYFENDKNVMVGQTAKDFMATEPKKVISTVKNAMGDDKKYSPLPNMTFRPQDISSFVLRKLVKDAEEFLGVEKITDVVVTVPAYFTDAQRSATNEAVKLAGLNLLSNVNEPTAAAIFYAHKSNMYEANTLVFDLGGGTFDVTIMHINNGEVEVKSTRGLKNVGGSFFDQQLVDYICEEFNDKHNIDLEDEEYIDVYQGLYEKVEKAKKQICKNKTQTLVPVSAGTEKDKIVITYDYFVDEIISKLCDKMENLVKMAISDAGLTVNDINQVIMVGGSSRIPYIEERITKLMGKNPLKVVNPDEVVALGAAIQADKLSKNVANNVKDVCSHGLGIIRYSPKEEKKINEVMIPRNTQVPTNVVGEACFAFAQDGQKFLKVVVTEGDYDDVTYAVTIKELQFDLPEGIKYGMKYTISMAVDEKQDIAVSIEIPEMKKKLEMSVRSQSSEGKSDNDVSPELINILKGMSVA